MVLHISSIFIIFHSSVDVTNSGKTIQTVEVYNIRKKEEKINCGLVYIIVPHLEKLFGQLTVFHRRNRINLSIP